MTDDKYILLGKYVESLIADPNVNRYKPLRVALRFLKDAKELSVKAKKTFIESHIGFSYGSNLEYLNDFLYFAGVRIGPKRKVKKKILEKKTVVSERNNKAIASFIKWLGEERDYSPKTLNSYEYGIKQYFSYTDEFSKEMAKRYIETLESKGRSPKTINLRILTLNHFGKFIKKPIELKKQKIQSSLHLENVPTEKEYKDLLKWTNKNDPDFMYWIIRLLGSTGMRCSELKMIQWSHVIEGEAYLKCKGAKYRTIYFPETLKEEARKFIEIKKWDPSRYVMTSQKGMRLSSRGLSNRLWRMARKSGYPREKAHCHAFRHFFAKMFLAKTGDLVQLADLLGHESVDTTRIYLQKSKAEYIKDINNNVKW